MKVLRDAITDFSNFHCKHKVLIFDLFFHKQQHVGDMKINYELRRKNPLERNINPFLLTIPEFKLKIDFLFLFFFPLSELICYKLSSPFILKTCSGGLGNYLDDVCSTTESSSGTGRKSFFFWCLMLDCFVALGLNYFLSTPISLILIHP